MTVQKLYDRFCRFVLEDGGLQLGLLSEDEFVAQYVNVAQDFLRKTGLIQRLFVGLAGLGQPMTTLPEWVVEPLHVFYNERYLNRSSLSDVEESYQNWMTDLSGPRSWRNDRMGLLEIELIPAPNRNPAMINLPDVTVATTEIDAATDYPKAFYAQLAGDTPTGTWRMLYGDPAGPLVGTRTNVSVIATANVVDEDPDLAGQIELIPDSFAVYILFGVLCEVFNQDGELKDLSRANYCRARFDEGVNLAKAIMTDELGADQEK